MTEPRPRAMLWTGRVLSGLAVLFLVVDGGIKLQPLPIVLETMRDLGWPVGEATARGLGILLLAATALYAWPRTAVLGAVLLTGYLGGAIATQLRAGTPLFSHLLFGVYVGLVLWSGLYLRDARLRDIFPFRR